MRSSLGLPPPRAAGLAPATAPPPPAMPPAGGGAQHHVTLDPMSLRRRITIRSGLSALVIDEQRLLLRSWLRRKEIAWADLVSFEARFEGAGAPGSGGHLVAVTRSGPVDLPATKRSMSDLRYLQALLDAYRQRAQGGVRG